MTEESPTMDFVEQLSRSLNAGLTEEGAARVKKQAEDILREVLEDIEWRLETDSAVNIAWHVQDLFKRGFEAMLEGNEEEFRRHIYASGYTGRDHSNLGPVVHGRLFEGGPLKLRRRLAQAYPELIRNERIADLESHVEALVEQVNKLEAENKRLRGDSP